MSRLGAVAALVFVGAFTATVAGRPALAGAKLELDEDRFISLGLLMQAQLHFAENGTADQRHWSFDPRLRRLRILLSGQYTELVSFFVETDQPNWGYRSDWEGGFFVQDAFVELNLHEALQIDVGMLLVPFSHHGSQGATTLLTLDYHSSPIKYLPGAQKVWRDMGVMVRGELLSRRLEYRLTATNGVQSGYLSADEQAAREEAGVDPDGPPYRNRLDYPWLTGRLVFNLFESEAGPGLGGYFLDGLYLKEEDGELLSPKRIVSLGVSGTFQKDAAGASGAKADYRGFAADVFVDYPLASATEAVNGQVSFYAYHLGPSHPMTGHGAFAEAGYRIGRWQPVVGVDWYDATEDDTDAFDLLAVHGGFNWWLQGHAVNLKAQMRGERQGPAGGSFGLGGTIQAHLLF